MNNFALMNLISKEVYGKDYTVVECASVPSYLGKRCLLIVRDDTASKVRFQINEVRTGPVDDRWTHDYTFYVEETLDAAREKFHELFITY